MKEDVIQDWKTWTKGTSKGTREFLNTLEKKQVVPGSGLEFDTLLAVLNEMFDEENRQRIIIFQGDGSEIVWLKTDDDAFQKNLDSIRKKWRPIWMSNRNQMRNFGLADIKNSVERSRATIFSVATGIRFLGFSKKEQKTRAKTSVTNTFKSWGMRENILPIMTQVFQERVGELLSAGQIAMSKVAESSGGFISFIEKPEDAESVYSNIFENIKNRYVIGYYPTDEARDGERRTVKIEVRGHPEYTVTGRKSYISR